MLNSEAKLNKQGFANIVIMIIVLVVAVGAGVGVRYLTSKKSPAVPSQKEQQSNTTEVIGSSNQRNCEKEKGDVVERIGFGKPAVLTGLIDFPNKNFSLSSFTVNAGVYDSSPVQSDGSFCLVNNKELKAVLVTVGTGDGVILMALATSRSDEELFVVSPASTAVTMIAFPSVAYLAPEINEAIFDFIKASPRTRPFIDALSKELIELPATATDSSSILERPYIEQLYNDAKKALEDKLKELIQ